MERALPEGIPDRPDGRELFTSVLASDPFASGFVGPFDLHMLIEDELSSRKEAEMLRDELLETLRPAAELVERLWPAGGGGLVSDVRLPLVGAESQGKDRGFASVVELLDHCERLGYSDWLPTNEVDRRPAREARPEPPAPPPRPRHHVRAVIALLSVRSSGTEVSWQIICT